MSFFDLSTRDLDGRETLLSEFRGKVCLVVNTASRCGFTSQYAGLEELYQEYKDRGFIVLAFPSNDYANQESGSDGEIKQFCELNYRTTFPIFTKAHVRGAEKQPTYKFLTEQSAEKFRGDPGWNFVKFLVNRKGEVAARFSAMTAPTSKKIKKQIEVLLAESEL